MIGGRSCSDLALFLDNADDDDAFPASVESPSPSELHTLGDLGCLQKRSITISKRRQRRHLVFFTHSELLLAVFGFPWCAFGSDTMFTSGENRIKHF